MIRIDQEKCIGCGICTTDCFMMNLSVEGGKAIAKDRCFLCGHCVAVCPSGAVSLEEADYSMKDVIEYDRESFEMEPEHLLNFIRFRRSIRVYQKRAVEPEKIRQVLEAGRFTQTASNWQDVAYTVVQEELEQVKPLVWNSLRELAQEQPAMGEQGNPYASRWMGMYDAWKADPETDGMFFRAPVLLVITSESKWNGLLAAESIELMANACGLGALFSGFIERAVDRSGELRELLQIGSRKIDTCMLLGYPDIIYYRTAPRKPAEIHWK